MSLSVDAVVTEPAVPSVDLWSPEREVNIAWYIPELAKKVPEQAAIIMPGARRTAGVKPEPKAALNFRQLDELCNRYARGLIENGIVRGTKVLLMVKPSPDFFALTFALFKVGAVPVMIDPGLGKAGFLSAVQEAKPEAFIGIPIAHVARLLYPRAFDSVKIKVTVGPRLFWGGLSSDALKHQDASPLELAPTRAGELAAILFTSGSTGPAKGVEYTHGIFDAQTRLIGSEWGIEAGEVDLPAFPLFALFSCALGVTCVIPEMDFTRPAKADPVKILAAIEDYGVTYSFGSPAFWKTIGRHLIETKQTLPGLRRIIMAGAPVPPKLLYDFESLLPNGDVFIPYGATEALPVSKTRGRELLAGPAEAMSRGEGSCVGTPLAVNDVRIIRLSDEPIGSIEQAEPVPTGEVGEIIVRGPTTTQAYYGRPEDTRRSKIADGVSIWHRMGDVGYLDAEGRLWFCGRKSHCVETSSGRMFTIPCEGIFNRHERVYRSALVGVGPRGSQRPVICVECEPNEAPKNASDEASLRAELLELGASSPLTESIREVLFHPAFPVDVRHNAKIRRETLAVWAAGKLGPSARA